MNLEFASLSALFLYLRRTSPPAADKTWERLGTMTLLSGGHGEEVALEDPRATLSEVEKARSAEAGAQEASPSRPRRWRERIPLASLFQRIRLAPSGRTERGTRFLVLPSDAAAPRMRELVEALADMESFTVFTSEVASPGGPGSLAFDLRALDDQELPVPYGLPGAPYVLTAIAGDVFVPPGFTSKLLPAYRLFLPPPTRERIHAWLPGQGDAPAYRDLRWTEAGLVPLARAILVPPGNAPVALATAGTSKLEAPLRLRPTHRRRPVERASRVVYVAESRAGELGAGLLRVLEHAEAGIEHFTYCNRTSGAGPNAVVQHYLQVDAALVDDDLWPELRRFDLPRVLDDRGLPLFIPKDVAFSPDLEGVLPGLDSSDPFLARLRDLVGLSTAESGSVALVDLDPASGELCATVLSGARPLASMIAFVLESFHREPFRQVVDVTRVDLAEDRKHYEVQWAEAGRAEAQEIASATDALAGRLAEAAQSVERELQALSSRLEALRQVSDEARGVVDRAPREVTEFVDRVHALVASLADPRRAWLLEEARRREEVATLQAAARDLQSSVTQAVEATRDALAQRRDELVAADRELAERGAELERVARELEPVVRSSEAAATHALAAIEARHQRVLAMRAALETREREVAAEAQRVDALQAEVVRREQELARRRAELARRRSELEARMRAAVEGERLAVEEEQALRHMQDVQIPELLARVAAAERALAALRQQRIPERLAATRAEFDRLTAESRRLEADLAAQQELERELRRLEPEVTRLREQVDARTLEARNALAQDLREDARTFSELSRALEAARTGALEAQRGLATARPAVRRVLELRGAPELEERLAGLEAEIGRLAQEAGHAVAGRWPPELERRYRDLAAAVARLEPRRGVMGRLWGSLSGVFDR